MRPLHLIVNPAAGRGSAGKSLAEIEELLRIAAADYRISKTTAPGEAVELAEKAAEDCGTIVAVGGDGTINEVVNGMIKSDAVLGIVPVGSGNDFIKAAGIPHDVKKAVDVLISGEVTNVDLGNLNGKRFVNFLAMGIDGAVADTMNKAKWLPPSLAYHFGVLANVFFYRNRLIQWHTEDEHGSTKANLATVMNGHCYGGGYNVAPPASITDGLLDLVIVGDYGIGGRMRYLPKLKKGTHLGHEKMHHCQAKRVTISCEEPMPMSVDGERVQIDDGFELEIEVLPGALPLLVPANAEN